MAKGPFMEFLRGRVTESAVRTYTENELDTPCSKTEKMAMLIHMVEFHHEDLVGVDAAALAITAGLYKDSQAGPVSIHHPDTVCFYAHNMSLGRTQGTLSEYVEQIPGNKIQHFDPPILYAKAKIYFGVLGYDSTATSTQKMICDVRIGYTLEKVSSEDFIAALVE